MTCDGCLNAVKRSLNKNLGSKILSIEGDLNEQVKFLPQFVSLFFSQLVA